MTMPSQTPRASGAHPVAPHPIAPGFADPVMQSQAVFRAIMAALSQPGHWQELGRDPADSVHGVVPPAGLMPSVAAALLTLADHETPVWLPPPLRAGPAAGWLRFHCGCPLTDNPAGAAFAVLAGDAVDLPPLAAFSIGEERFPDRSTTVLVPCGARAGGAAVRLSGPGIETARDVAPAGLRPGFWAEAAENARRYPLGVDLILADASALLGLPRSTRIGGFV
jgi:alpha-D-ribose 1-methylphosphonate 5-triphosphate synthase subunit PhnH